MAASHCPVVHDAYHRVVAASLVIGVAPLLESCVELLDRVQSRTAGRHHQNQGVGQALVQRLTQEATPAECEWLHVDYEPHLAIFYEQVCG